MFNTCRLQFILPLSLLLASFALQGQPERPFPDIDWHRQFLELPEIDMIRDVSTVIPLDPDFSKQWWFHNFGQPGTDGVSGVIGADTSMLKALEIYRPQQTVILAVIDSGLDLAHEDIDPSILWTNEVEAQGQTGIDDDQNGYIDDLHGINMVMKNSDFSDHLGHGTHVTGLIGAASNNQKGIFGNVPGIKIMLIKLWDSGGDIHFTPTAEAIRYACDNGAKVLSNSYGTPSANQATKEAIEYCQTKGALFVGAAGNFGQNLDQTPDYPSSFQVANQIVVGASNRLDGRALFSNYGQAVELFAPGEEIYSLKPKNRYQQTSGTSQACPLVAQAAAMLWAHEPSLSLEALKERLLEAADQRRSLEQWSKNGRRLNTYKALLGVPGERLPLYDFATWSTTKVTFESAHPYPRRLVTTQDLQIAGAKAFRLHFRKVDISKYDWLTLKAGDEIINQYNGQLDDFWSPVIEGDQVQLILNSHSGPLSYGYHVDQVEWWPTSSAN